VLERGIKGKDVAAWQTFLKLQGFAVTIDSDFGPGTERATKAFQARNSLREDGKVGPNTLAAAKTKGFELPHDFGREEDLIEKPVTLPAPSNLEMFAGDRIVQINRAKLAKVAPNLRNRADLFIAAAQAEGVILQIVQGLRTFAEQDALYAQGRTRPGKRVTNARGGQSMHNFGLALDLAPVVAGVVSWNEALYRPFGKWAAAAGLEWGGDWKKFKDLPHVQLPHLPPIPVLQSLYRNGGLAKVWAAV